ncbi:hypothetical protein ACRAWF_47235 [Streptomyces sp. L7]
MRSHIHTTAAAAGALAAVAALLAAAPPASAAGTRDATADVLADRDVTCAHRRPRWSPCRPGRRRTTGCSGARGR